MAERPSRDSPQPRHHNKPEVPSSHGQRTSKRRPPQDPPLVIGGKYARLTEIGRGSFAIVYQGVHKKHNSYLAIKSVNRSKLSEKLMKNLELEIGILKSLHHPHIVALLDCVETPSEIHLVMEYCGLGDLAMFIKRRHTLGNHYLTKDMVAKYPNPQDGCLNEVFIRHFLKQFSCALHFLRKAHLIHRDIKPQNLLLNPSPDMFAKGLCRPIPYMPSDDSLTPLAGLSSLPMLKIADFGFARSLPSTSLAETLCGSPLYMAPEILKYQSYDAKADLWSVGAVAYEMVVGRPPFRAGNHVELLRRIERQKDKIRFPEGCPASDEMIGLIKALLKQNPTERMSYEDFFNSSVIKDEIPGLLPEDRMSPDAGQKRTSVQEGIAGTSPGAAKLSSSPSQKGGELIATPRPPSGNYSKSAGHVRHIGSRDRSDDLQRAAVTTARRASTANQQGQEGRARTPESAPMERQRSRNTSSPDSSFIKERAAEEPAPPRRKQSGVKDAARDRERAVQDVAFERDYVVVEKRAVEMNAFADELAASPRIPQPRNHSPLSQDRAVVRRPPTGTSPQSQSPNLGQANTNRTMQLAGRPRADSSHQRQNSYERRYGPSSATSAVSKALNMATGRLFGKGFSSPQAFGRAGRSPPLGYNPFPAYPTQDSLVVIGPGAKSHAPMNEDERTVQLIEDCATRSDVVYGFAEVKYKQLIPLTPSTQPEHAMQPGTGPVEAGVDSAGMQDDGLTVDAMVTLSEEALVLYVKVLALLAKSMDIAGSWWARKNRGEVIGDLSLPSEKAATAVAAATRVNAVVQWIRSRFNEVLEKAEYVRLKLSENQARLPADHPSHPNSHPADAELAAGLGASVDPVFVSSGVTAEKLMYDRALEMSRSAAINELTGEDLQGCELSYTTAIMMLEAVLEDEEEETPRPKKSSKGNETPSDKEGQKNTGDATLGVEDREMVVKLVASIRTRLAAVKKKLAMLANRTLPPGTSPKTATPQHPPASPAVQPTPTPQLAPSSPRTLPAQMGPLS